MTQISETLQIRKAVAADCDAVAALHIASMQETYRAFLSDDYLDNVVPEERRTRWRERFATLGGPGYALHVATDANDVLAGFLCLTFIPGDKDGTLIDALHVSAAHRSAGLGRQLLVAGIADLTGDHRQAPMYLVVYEENHRARALYERLGGRIIGREAKFERGDGVYLVKYQWSDPASLMQALKPQVRT